MTDLHPSPTGVQVTTKRFPLAWLFWTFKTEVSIDGASVVVPWGTHFYRLHRANTRFELAFASCGARTWALMKSSVTLRWEQQPSCSIALRSS